VSGLDFVKPRVRRASEKRTEAQHYFTRFQSSIGANWWDSCPFCGSRAKHLNDCNFRLIIPTSVAKSAQRTIWRIHPDGSHAPDASAPYNLGVVPWLFVLADEDSMVGGTHCFFRAISSLNWAQRRLGI
jgi:hypothetical protein